MNILAYVSKYADVSARLTLHFMRFLSSSESTDAVVSVVSPGNVTDRVLQETDLVFPSGLYPANGVCQSTL